jgi:hypothetical protein
MSDRVSVKPSRVVRYLAPLLLALLVALAAVTLLGWPTSTSFLRTSGALYHPSTALDPNGTGQWVEVETVCGACSGTNPLLVLGLFAATYIVVVVVIRRMGRAG